MLENYLKIAARNMRRYPGYSAINIVGLAVGVGCCLLIFLFVRNELSVNTALAGVDRIYRLDSDWREASMGLSITTLAPVGERLVEEYAEVIGATRVYLMTNRIRVGDTSLRRDVMMTDPEALSLLGLPLRYGDPRTALNAPRSVVITDSLAEALFGTMDVLGRTVLFETWQAGEQPFTITGVRQTLPYNSVTHFNSSYGQYDLIIPAEPFDFFPEEGWISWESRYIMQYVKVAPGTDVEALQRKLDGFIEAHAPEAFHGNLSLRLNPLRTLYLADNDGQGWRMIGILSTVALLILLIACINFVNLSTARALARAKEVGVRKAVGAERTQLIAQFLGESLLVALLATALGTTLAGFGFKPLLYFADKSAVLAQPWDVITFGILLLVVLVTGALAGLYPAFALSSFKPTAALKGMLYTSSRTAGLRKALVVAQFAIAVILLIAVYTVAQQMNFILNKELGFEQEQVLVINSVPRAFDEAGLAQVERVKARLLALPEVEAASLSWRTAAEGTDSRALQPTGWHREDAVSVQTAVVDEDFLATYGIALQEGRFFSKERTADHQGVVLNETAASVFGWERGVSGKALRVWGSARPDADAELPPAQPVLGVVKDFHFESLHSPIRPLAFVSVRADTLYRVLGVRLAAGAQPRAALASVAAAWKEALPHAPFEFTFLDDQVEQGYRTEQQMRHIAGLAAVFAIVIACLGMLGLAALSTQQRTREIGVRKVLGASAVQILVLLSRDFTRPVLLAILLALPVAYLLLQRWLGDFAYAIELSAGIFLGAACTALLVAWLTVGYYTLRAARTDPACALRHE